MRPTLNMIGIGLVAGFATAVLSVGSVVQNYLSIALLMLSPLPILLAGLGWGYICAIIAVIACGLSITLVAGQVSALVILMIIAIPATLAAYLSGMARHDGDRTDWFPLGLILLLVALTVAFGVVIVGYTIGYNAEYVEKFSNELALDIAKTNADLAKNPSATKAFVSLLIKAIPYLQPATWLLVIMGNLWLSLMITQRSGLCHRPRDNWPDELNLPSYALLLFALALFGALFSQSLGSTMAVFTGALAMALTMTGFAHIHAVTRGNPWRPVALWVSYVATFSFGLVPIFLFIGLYRSAKNSVADR